MKYVPKRGDGIGTRRVSGRPHPEAKGTERKSGTNPDPNGGDGRSLQASRPKMPKRDTTSPLTHTPLDVGDDFAGLGAFGIHKHTGRTPRDPVKR